MKLTLTHEEMEKFTRYADESGDCERLGENEYVMDLYEIERPVTLDLVAEGDALIVDGAARLMYDEAMDGWYMADPLTDARQVRDALAEAGAL